jgi:4-amino-4-deoxy-L-arabinose transferase-like glycosyltransferase
LERVRTAPARDRFAVWIVAIAVGGLAIRVAYILIFRTQQLPLPFYDSLIYHLGGNDLAQGKGFVDAFTRAQTAAHPPLYLLWLAAISLVSPGQAATPTTHMLWSSLLGVGTIFLCGWTGREIAGVRAGILAALIAAVYPNLWVNDGLLMSESLAMLCVAAVLFTTYRFIHRPTGWRAVWVGVGCGLATLARTELVLTIPLVLVVVVLTTGGIPWARRFQWAIGASLVAALLISPWVVYNLSRFDRPVYLSGQLGGTIATANCRSTFYGDLIGFKDYRCQAHAREQVERKGLRWADLSLEDQDQEYRAVAREYIDDHLTRVPVVVLARWARLVGVYRPLQEVTAEHRDFELETWAGYLLLVSFWAAAAFAVAGIVAVRRLHERLWPLLAFPVIVLMSVAITFAQTRYRAPAEVPVVLLAALGVDLLVRWWTARGTPPERAPDAAPVTEAST